MDPILGLLKEVPNRDWQWRFSPGAPGHSAVNAVALCNVALLAYSGDANLKDYLAQWQLTDVRILSGGNTQGFVARQDGAVFVAFRGTEPVQSRDWLSDVEYQPRSLLSSIPGMVHSGFAAALVSVMRPMCEAVRELAKGARPRVFITGHSLGGALAVLGAAVLEFDQKCPVTAVYTFGQPRVSDQEFARAYDARLGTTTFRYVNDFDIVPHLPPASLLALPRRGDARDGENVLQRAAASVASAARAVMRAFDQQSFVHVGQLKLLQKDGSVTSDEREWQKREVLYSGPLLKLPGQLPELVHSQFVKLLRAGDRLLDHDPLRGYFPKLRALAA
jgi:triacylglycerol lipase